MDPVLWDNIPKDVDHLAAPISGTDILAKGHLCLPAIWI